MPKLQQLQSIGKKEKKKKSKEEKDCSGVLLIQRVPAQQTMSNDHKTSSKAGLDTPPYTESLKIYEITIIGQ